MISQQAKWVLPFNLTSTLHCAQYTVGKNIIGAIAILDYFLLLLVKLSLLIFFATFCKISLLLSFIYLLQLLLFQLSRQRQLSLFIVLYFSISPLRAKKSNNYRYITIIRRALTIRGSLQKRSHEYMYKTDTKSEAKRIRATTHVIAKLEDQYRKI